MDKHEENERPEYRSLTTDIAIGLGPTAAVVAAHLLSKGQVERRSDPTEKD